MKCNLCGNEATRIAEKVDGETPLCPEHFEQAIKFAQRLKPHYPAGLVREVMKLASREVRASKEGA